MFLRVRFVLFVLVVSVVGIACTRSDEPADEHASSLSAAVPRTLYVTNRGSNQAAIFGIGKDGTLTPFAPLVNTGVAPRGIVFAPDAGHAYVLNSGENTIWSYAVGSRGELVEAHRIGTGANPFGIALSPDGAAIYSANADDGNVSAFQVEAGGALTAVGTEPSGDGGGLSRGVAVTPDGRFAFSTNASTITTYAIERRGKLRRIRITPPLTDPNEGSPFGLAITPDGHFLYATVQASTRNLFAFHIERDGSLTRLAGNPFSAAKFAEGMAITPDGRHLYVTCPASPDFAEARVSAFALGSDGTPHFLDHFVAGAGAVGIAVTPDGRHLYVSNFQTNDVSAFRIEGNGRLVAIERLPSGGHLPAFQSVAVLPNQGPRASFVASHREAGHPTTFDASASSDRDGRVARYDWDFGDGSTFSTADPAARHVYRNAGRYTVVLTVTDREGCSTASIHTGTSTLCNGSPAARAARSIVIE